MYLPDGVEEDENLARIAGVALSERDPNHHSSPAHRYGNADGSRDAPHLGPARKHHTDEHCYRFAPSGTHAEQGRLLGGEAEALHDCSAERGDPAVRDRGREDGKRAQVESRVAQGLGNLGALNPVRGNSGLVGADALDREQVAEVEN